jgi:hypothetical protein
MARQHRSRLAHHVTVGFAAGPGGSGVAYAAAGAGGRNGSPVRVEFVCRALPALRGRDVAYSALDAVLAELLRRGVTRAVIAIDDANLPLDVSERRSLPNALIVPYVALRCRLNQFAAVTVVEAHDAVARDLTARARAEATLIAA